MAATSFVITSAEVFDAADDAHPAWRITRDGGGTFTVENLADPDQSLSGFASFDAALTQMGLVNG